jgi:uncharacterized protein YbcI
MINKTKGQIEDAIAKEITKFYAAQLGLGPRNARVYLAHDMVIVRLKGNTHPYEHILLKQSHGVATIKNMRTAILESVVDQLTQIIEKNVNATVVSTHADSSTRTGERFVLFVLDRMID